MQNSFKDKTVLITGAATGLGAAVAELAAAEGARVALLDVNAAAGEDTARRVGGRFFGCNVADPADWSTVVARVEGELGPIRYAHLNAGVMTQGIGATLDAARFEQVSVERYRTVVGVNVDGVVFGLQALLPRMIAHGGDAITVTSSAAGLTPIPFDPIYALTKHAVVGLVRSLALAYAGGPVRINAICPGGFQSPLVPPEFREATTMSAADMGREVLGLMTHGAMGETRLKLRKDLPATAVPPPAITLG